jgi:hypothetical protein
MSQDEIAVMDGGKCIMQLRGVRPFFSDKFDITKHGRHKELSDYDRCPQGSPKGFPRPYFTTKGSGFAYQSSFFIKKSNLRKERGKRRYQSA